MLFLFLYILRLVLSSSDLFPFSFLLFQLLMMVDLPLCFYLFLCFLFLLFFFLPFVMLESSTERGREGEQVLMVKSESGSIGSEISFKVRRRLIEEGFGFCGRYFCETSV